MHRIKSIRLSIDDLQSFIEYLFLGRGSSKLELFSYKQLLECKAL